MTKLSQLAVIAVGTALFAVAARAVCPGQETLGEVGPEALQSG